MDEALEKVRATLGSDAMIVSTRTFKRGGVLGVGGQEFVEVYVADTRSRIENIKRENSSRSRVAEPTMSAEKVKSRKRVAATSPKAPAPNVPSPKAPALKSPPSKKGTPSPTPSSKGPTQGPEDYETFSSAIGQIGRDLRDLLDRSSEPPRQTHPFLKECYETLISREVDPRVADLIVGEIANLRLPRGYPDPSRARAVVGSQLMKLFVANPPLDDGSQPRTVVLVGPTGVGKTTTIAKLAARAKINEKRRVGLITLDTFRIAAVDQLEKYAEIIGLPLLVATNPRELEEAVEEFHAKKIDMVFIDSAGRSPRDELKMTELREFLSVLPDAEVHLVLSTTTHGKTILSTANRFSGIGFQKVILTKVDETISFGSLVNALVSIGRPVSFVTDGQNVPDDIVTSDPERLADLVLKANAL